MLCHIMSCMSCHVKADLITSISINIVHLFSGEGFLPWVIPHRSGGYVIANGSAIKHFDWDTRTVTTLADVKNLQAGAAFNDGKCDASGRLVVGQCLL